MTILIAPNAFKGSLKAQEVADAIAEGLKRSKLAHQAITMPIADGGDGTMEVLVGLLGGSIVSAEVADPLGRSIKASYGLADGGNTAIIEMAAASGVALLTKDELNPLKATSYGTGQLIIDALNRNVNHVIIALGGSATVDGGLGMLQALGLVAANDKGDIIGKGGGSLVDLAKVEADELAKNIDSVKFTLLCDVDNLLLGKNGAASVFGPQKGATPEMVEQLEAGLAKFAEVTDKLKHTNVATLKHGGAAGGSTAFLSAYLGADIVEGTQFLLDKKGFEKQLLDADVLITAEGRIDSQTKQGKGPYAVAKLAKAAGLSVIALAGQVAPGLDTADFEAFDAIFPIASGPMSLDEAYRVTRENLVRTAQQVGNLLG